jgi:hypothetical protein
MAQIDVESSAVLASTLTASKQANLRRYGAMIVDEVCETYRRKRANGAIVSTIKTAAGDIATAIEVPKQVAGRTLTAMVTLFPGVRRASRSYAFDVDRLPELRQKLQEIQDLETRAAEAAAIEEIVRLYGPVTGREIQTHLSRWLGYDLTIGQVNARIDDVGNSIVVPGNLGYISAKEF